MRLVKKFRKQNMFVLNSVNEVIEHYVKLLEQHKSTRRLCNSYLANETIRVLAEMFGSCLLHRAT